MWLAAYSYFANGLLELCFCCIDWEQSECFHFALCMVYACIVWADCQQSAGHERKNMPQVTDGGKQQVLGLGVVKLASYIHTHIVVASKLYQG